MKTLLYDQSSAPADGIRLRFDAGNEAAEAALGAYRTIFWDAAEFTTRTTNGMTAGSEEYATNDMMSNYFLADKTTNEAVQIRKAMPDEWNRGTIKAKFFWTTGAAANDVIFGLRAAALTNDDALDGSWGTGIEVTDTVLAADDLHVTAATAAITVGGSPALGDLILFEVYRNAAAGGDTLDADAKFLGVQIQYQENAADSAAW